jgi:undecaprenyl phosphate-alpha-L-ara4FN deformylase
MNSPPEKILSIKVDVDTDRGTRQGVANLLHLFAELKVPATFLFSLGPDNTGRAIKRIFRPGFLKKAGRSNVISLYGIRTLLNGVLLPGPHIGKRNQDIIYKAHAAGHETGIHSYDHVHWQDNLFTMTQEAVFTEFAKARHEFQRIFGFAAKTAGTAGWQANASSLAAYDDAQLLYGSDCRGYRPFFPQIGDNVFHTLQIPTTLPTLDELLGHPEHPLDKLTHYYLNLLSTDAPNIFTIHAEIEGMKYLYWLKEFLQAAVSQRVRVVKMEEIAHHYLAYRTSIPTCKLIQRAVAGRSGNLAIQA